MTDFAERKCKNCEWAEPAADAPGGVKQIECHGEPPLGFLVGAQQSPIHKPGAPGSMSLVTQFMWRSCQAESVGCRHFEPRTRGRA